MSGEKGKILIVDDEESNRSLFTRFLAKNGYAAVEAEDGETALAVVEREKPDAVLLDVMMPKLDGYEVCRRLKGNPKTAHLPVILVTGLTERDDRIKGMEAGADDFLTKPVDWQEVVLRVRNAVRVKRLFDELQLKYDQLMQMSQLSEALTQMLKNDNAAMSALLNRPGEDKTGSDPYGTEGGRK